MSKTSEEHPTVRAFRERERGNPTAGGPAVLDAAWLKTLCLEAGADDVGFVDVDRPEIADQRDDVLALMPRAKTLISFVRRMNRGNVRSDSRSAANLEFHHRGDEVTAIGSEIVRALEARGVNAINPAMGFPMEADRWPGKMWVVSHKPIAEAAGLGRMGIHRNVIHPRFGNFVLLGTVVVDAEVAEYDRPVDFNPCLECKLCVAACPTGAISSDGRFDFAACYTHNYREFMGGFSDWVETVVESPDARAYRRSVSDAETVSTWQSLAFGPNYKAAYCMSVCPAGEDVIGPYLTDRKRFLDDVVRPLQEKEETVYVVADSDAERYVSRRFPNKRPKRVRNGLRPATIRGFLSGLAHVFQRGRSAGLDATYHFTFTGDEDVKATIVVRDETLTVSEGHEGDPDLRVIADSRTWLEFLAKERGIVWALLRRKIRLAGPPRLLLAFGKCFPS